ncbi:hypothetical protein Tco_0662132 [Tanacetum coccineum]
MPPAINAYLGSSLGDALQKVLQKHTKELIQKYPHSINFATPVIQSTVKKELKKTPLPIAQSSSQSQSSLKAAKSLSEYELKRILFKKIDKSCSYLTHDKHQALLDALLNSMSLNDAISSEEPVEMASDDIEQTVDDVVTNADQIHADSTQTKDKAPKKDWFKQPPRPPTPNQEWNKHQYTMNRLKIDNLTQAHLVGPVYELLKGTCKSSIELEYNMEECFKALTDKLD